jgi:hypothetical protein
VDQGRSKIDRMLYAGSNLEKAKAIFMEAIKHRRQAADARAGAVGCHPPALKWKRERT